MKRALFLDRDGIVNYDEGYTHKKEHFVFINGIFELCRSFEEAGFLIFIITNQAGIAKGYYEEDDFLVLTKWVEEQFLLNDVHITKTYYCPYHPEATIPEYRIDSFNRKPNPGMILQASREFSINLARSLLIGDMEQDVLAGKNAGVGLNIIIGKSCKEADLSFNSLENICMKRIWGLIK